MGRLYKGCGEILVLVDGSEDGWRALRQAFLVAKKVENATVHAVYVIVPALLRLPHAYLPQDESIDIEPGPDAQTLRQTYHLWGKRVLEKAARRGEERGIPVQTEIIEGPWHNVLKEKATEIDLIVFGDTGISQKSLVPHLRGDMICRKTWRPVLVVTTYPHDLTHLAVAYDGSIDAQEALRRAVEMVRVWGIPLTVIVVDSPTVSGRAAADQAKAFLTTHDSAGQVLLRRGPVAKTLIDTTNEVGATCLVIGMYQHHWWHRILTGSNFHEILNHSDVPVLIIPPVKRTH